MENNFSLIESIEKLESVFLNILYLKPEELLVAPNINHLTNIKNALNEIFKDIMCTDVIYTLNTDKTQFLIKINPAITGADALKILTTDDDVKFDKYQVEFDSKLFDVSLSAKELAAFTVYEISSMVNSKTSVNDVRALIDLHVLADDDIIHIRDSINYSQLIVFAIKDTLFKVSSLMFKDDPEDILLNTYIQNAELGDDAIAAQQRLVEAGLIGNDSFKSPKTYILKWMFMVYKDMAHNARMIKETLKEAKEFTASVLEKQEIDKTLSAIDRIDIQSVVENCSLKSFIESKGLYSLNELSLFKSLKAKGLRGIEDDLYEYTLKVKTCDIEDEAVFVLRGINSRLSILEDYIYNTDLSESERKKWEAVAAEYRKLRENLVKNKIKKQKSYGLFFDYSALDNLD